MAPTANVVVHKVSQPVANESEPRDVARTSFIENLGGAGMHSGYTGADPIARWKSNGYPGGCHLQYVSWCVLEPPMVPADLFVPSPGYEVPLDLATIPHPLVYTFCSSWCPQCQFECLE